MDTVFVVPNMIFWTKDENSSRTSNSAKNQVSWFLVKFLYTNWMWNFDRRVLGLLWVNPQSQTLGLLQYIGVITNGFSTKSEEKKNVVNVYKLENTNPYEECWSFPSLSSVTRTKALNIGTTSELYYPLSSKRVITSLNLPELLNIGLNCIGNQVSTKNKKYR